MAATSLHVFSSLGLAAQAWCNTRACWATRWACLAVSQWPAPHKLPHSSANASMASMCLDVQSAHLFLGCTKWSSSMMHCLMISRMFCAGRITGNNARVRPDFRDFRGVCLRGIAVVCLKHRNLILRGGAPGPHPPPAGTKYRENDAANRHFFKGESSCG